MFWSIIKICEGIYLDNNNKNKMWISLLFAMSYVPKNNKMHKEGRPQHTFLYISKGEYIYKYGSNTFTARSGDVIYIPKGSVYTYEITSQSTYSRQVEFEINNPSFSFITHPVKIEGIANAENIFKEIIKNFGVNTQKYYFKALSSLYLLCTFIPEEEKRKHEFFAKIKPAVEYIELHCAEKISVKYLSDMCFMSQAQLRRHFQKFFNMSPITYKNNFRIETAKQMLLYDVTNLSEISEKLGFDSLQSFSKIFKQFAGITPSEFTKNKNEKY